MLTEKQFTELNWIKTNGMIPTIIQQNTSGNILMHGYMNKDALQETITHGQVTFFSRTKNRLWQKGETSGNYLKVTKIIPDCDKDSLLILVDNVGPTCHLGNISCFSSISSQPWYFFTFLENLIDSRKNADPNGSYTAKLYSAGIKRIAQKVGEEGLETALAAVIGNRKELIDEVSDLIYHLLLLLKMKNIDFNTIIDNLSKRHKSQ